MKKILLSVILTIGFAAAGAQSRMGALTVRDSKIAKDGDKITVTLTAEVGIRSVKKNYSQIFAPMLTDDTNSWSLPPIVVQGKKAKVSFERQMLASGNTLMLDDAFITSNGGRIMYTASVPYQQWMESSRLVMEGLNVGCCSSSPIVQEMMAEALVLQPEAPEVEEVLVFEDEAGTLNEEPLNTGEKLALVHPFIVPIQNPEEFEKEMDVENFYDDDRELSLTVYFRQGDARVDPDYSENRKNLNDLLSAIRLIEQAEDSELKVAMVAGFSSPEGSYQTNDRLAWQRAAAVKEYIVRNTGQDPATVKIYNGAEDWRGLRMLVEKSDMPDKWQVLDIIDNVPIWDSKAQRGRTGELMRLNGGEPYRYMFKHFFPQLRNAAYIRLYSQPVK